MSVIRGNVTGHLSLSNAIVAACTGNSVATVAVNAGGTGYTVGDILTVAGGTSTVTAQVEVTSVAAGVIDGVRRYNDGVYTVNPTLTGNAVTGGTGSSATVDLTMTAGNGWSVNRDAVYDGGSEREVMLQGTGGGADAIFVGWRTLSNAGSGYFNWELHGMTGYQSGNDMENQPGVSPGFFDASVAANTAGAYLLLSSASIDYHMTITPYRIILVAEVGGADFNAYLGWGNRVATSGEYPYPMCVAGHTNNPTATFGQTQLSSGLCDPWAADYQGDQGPMYVRSPDGVWYDVSNGLASGTGRTTHNTRNVLPCASPAGPAAGSTEPADKFVRNEMNFTDIIPATGSPSNATANLEPTPGTVDVNVLLPTLIVFTEPAGQVLMELDDVYWISAFGGVNSGDRAIVGGEVYRIFQNCNRATPYSFLAIKES